MNPDHDTALSSATDDAKRYMTKILIMIGTSFAFTVLAIVGLRNGSLISTIIGGVAMLGAMTMMFTLGTRYITFQKQLKELSK